MPVCRFWPYVLSVKVWLADEALYLFKRRTQEPRSLAPNKGELMSENYMPKKDALAKHFSRPSQTQYGSMTIFSGFAAALGDARKATGRDKNGQKIDSSKHGCWLGAIGYMALLDQMGTCFKPVGVPVEQGNTIRKALRYFSTLPDNEIDAIYALCCAFAHDFSLYNINTREPSLTHRFQVGVGGSMNVVTLPTTPWDGDYRNRAKDNVTTINLEAFGDLVEGICNQLTRLIQSDDLEVVLAGGTDELLQRYSFFSKP